MTCMSASVVLFAVLVSRGQHSQPHTRMHVNRRISRTSSSFLSLARASTLWHRQIRLSGDVSVSLRFLVLYVCVCVLLTVTM